MINPDEFYTAPELPDEKSRKRMWRSIESRVAPPGNAQVWLRDRRSFYYGMAASIILMLSFVGAWTLARQALENAQPEPIRVERAYVSAIQEFERVVPYANVSESAKPQAADQQRQRQEQLKLLNTAITELRHETGGGDVSPLKRERLRQLYSQELKILQLMIESGDIEL